MCANYLFPAFHLNLINLILVNLSRELEVVGVYVCASCALDKIVRNHHQNENCGLVVTNQSRVKK